MLVRDQPVILHCYVAEDALSPPADRPDPVEEPGRFCRRMGTEAKQGEVGLVIGDHYVAFTDFDEE